MTPPGILLLVFALQTEAKRDSSVAAGGGGFNLTDAYHKFAKLLHDKTRAALVLLRVKSGESRRILDALDEPRKRASASAAQAHQVRVAEEKAIQQATSEAQGVLREAVEVHRAR